MKCLKLGDKIIKVGDKVRLTDKRKHEMAETTKRLYTKDGTVMMIGSNEVLVRFEEDKQWWKIRSLGLEEFESIENG